MRKYHARFVGGLTEKESKDHLAGSLPTFCREELAESSDADARRVSIG